MNTETADWISDYEMARMARVSIYTLRRRWQRRYRDLNLPPVVLAYLPNDAAQRLINDLLEWRGQHRRHKRE